MHAKPKPSKRALKSAIRAHVLAQIELSERGGGDPEDWDAIGRHADQCAERLGRLIDRLYPLTPKV